MCDGGLYTCKLVYPTETQSRNCLTVCMTLQEFPGQWDYKC